MLVLLFHNNDEILIRKYQKDFINHNFSDDVIFSSQISLTPSLNLDFTTNDELKALSKNIASVTLEKPLWNEEKQLLELHLTLSYNDESNKALILPLVENLSQKKIAENQIGFPATSLFPKAIKTFRIGNQITLDAFSTAITTFVWH